MAIHSQNTRWKINFQTIDTGAEVNVMSVEVFNQLSLQRQN